LNIVIAACSARGIQTLVQSRAAVCAVESGNRDAKATRLRRGGVGSVGVENCVRVASDDFRMRIRPRKVDSPRLGENEANALWEQYSDAYESAQTSFDNSVRNLAGIGIALCAGLTAGFDKNRPQCRSNGRLR
jgi:hypothetical protein